MPGVQVLQELSPDLLIYLPALPNAEGTLWQGSNVDEQQRTRKKSVMALFKANILATACAVVSLKPRRRDWVWDFDFMLNLFFLPSPWNYYLYLRRIPYRSLWSYPRNRSLVNSWESQSLAAATIPQRFGHCTCSKLKRVECTKYVRVQAWTRACEQSVYVVCVSGWVVIVMVMCYLHPYQASTRTGALGLSYKHTHGCLFLNMCMTKHYPLYYIYHFKCVICTLFLTTSLVV